MARIVTHSIRIEITANMNRKGVKLSNSLLALDRNEYLLYKKDSHQNALAQIIEMRNSVKCEMSHKYLGNKEHGQLFA